MSKKSVIERNLKRKIMSERAFQTRQELKKMIKNPDLTLKEKLKYIQKLDSMPVDGSKVRYRNRCSITGRGRAVDSLLGISRIMMRQYCHYIPGFKKASW